MTYRTNMEIAADMERKRKAADEAAWRRWVAANGAGRVWYATSDSSASCGPRRYTQWHDPQPHSP